MNPCVSPRSPAFRGLPWLLTVVLALPSPSGAQQPAAPAKPLAPLATVRSLKVRALAGNNEMNDLERKVMAPLVVQVVDQNDRPVEGAEVVFRFPVKGPSAVFGDQTTSQTVRSNADGQAAATGWMANNEVGSFQVRVTASRGNDIGDTTITMTNATRIVEEGRMKPKRWWSSRWVKIGILAGAGAAAAAAILVTRGGNGGGGGTTVITARPGSPTVGGPP
jgi:hypothetical protein